MTQEQLLMIGVPIITALITTVGVLYKQLMNQQKQFEQVLRESVTCFSTVAELIRQSNALFVEVKEVLMLCKQRSTHDN